MKDDNTKLSRRKVLGSLGVIGGASVLGGAGTMALFNDTETFENNSLVAGSLDLKLDWQEHYYNSLGEAENYVQGYTADGYTVDPASEIGLPDPKYPVAAVKKKDLDLFMKKTCIEAYPDHNDDGVQDEFAANPGETTDAGVGYICVDGADTSEDLDPDGGMKLRTKNDDTVENWPLSENEDAVPAPLIDLSDVKPGDFGELTLSLHLCDNPGYIWMNGKLTVNDENDQTEPELIAEGEDTDGVGELAEAIQTVLWYDRDCDNVLEPGSRDKTVFASGSLKDVLGELKSGPGKLLNASAYHPHEMTASGSGNTTSTGTSCREFGKLEYVSGNDFKFENEDPGRELGGDQYKFFTDDGSEVIIELSGFETKTNGELVEFDFEVISPDDIGICKAEVKGGTGTETYLYDCTTTGQNLRPPENDGEQQAAISNVVFYYCQQEDDGNDGEPPECFEPSTTHCVGFAWWLPEDSGNELQTDSVGFDLGFYTEQCHHNDVIEPPK